MHSTLNVPSHPLPHFTRRRTLLRTVLGELGVGIGGALACATYAYSIGARLMNAHNPDVIGLCVTSLHFVSRVYL